MDGLLMTVSEKGLNFQFQRLDCIKLEMITSFNPIKKLSIVDMISALPSVDHVTDVIMLTKTTGNIRLTLKEKATMEELKDEMLEMLSNVIV